jgi:hypothetical protein
MMKRFLGALTEISTRHGVGMVIVGTMLQGATALAQTMPVSSFTYGSQTGDWVGQGKAGSYASSNSKFSAIGNKESVTVAISAGTGDSWSVNLAAPRGEELRPGTFNLAERAPFRTGRSPGLDVSGAGRGCNAVWGNFTIFQVGFDSTGKLSTLDASFTQRCDYAGGPAAAALSGQIKFNALPLSLSLNSEPGDYIGQGKSKSYTNDASTFRLTGTLSRLSYSASGLRDNWTATIQAPTGKTLVPGIYKTGRFASSTVAGLDFAGNGKGCDSSSGTLTIHSISANSTGSVSGLSASFTQRCDNSSGLLKGTIRFREGSSEF